MPLVYPVTTEALEPPLCYEAIIGDFYDESAAARRRIISKPAATSP